MTSQKSPAGVKCTAKRGRKNTAAGKIAGPWDSSGGSDGELNWFGMLEQFAESPDMDGELAAQLAGQTFAIHAMLRFSGSEDRIVAAAGLPALTRPC